MNEQYPGWQGFPSQPQQSYQNNPDNQKSKAGAIVALVLACLSLILMPKVWGESFYYIFRQFTFLLSMAISLALGIIGLIKSIQNLKVQKEFSTAALIISCISLGYIFLSFMAYIIERF
jgi:hypothetical protein